MPMSKVTAHADRLTLEWTPERMLSRLDGDAELAQQLAVIFVDEYPRMLDRLRTAIAGGSADEVRRAAHALKGSAANFIDGGPTASAFELETMGRAGQLAGAAAILDRLEQELVALSACLRQFHSKGATPGTA
jgi:HPt (histidine-containing phosphotransfer) domain-containing protein